MSKEKLPLSADRPPFLGRWDTIISFLALMVSLVSLWLSIQAGNAESAPNVQIKSVDNGYSGKQLEPNDAGVEQTSSIVAATVVIKNLGGAAVQIVNVRWEPVPTGTDIPIEPEWFGIADNDGIDMKSQVDYFKGISRNPVLGIKAPTIKAKEEKTLYIRFKSRNGNVDRSVPNIRVVLVFSSGQELTILPDIKYIGAGI